MSYSIPPLIYEQFKGIRENNGVNSNGAISAIECKNVALVQTEIGNNVGIRSMEGNSIAYTLPLGYRTLGLFKTTQDKVDYLLLYGETSEKGTLFYKNNFTGYVEVLIDNLTVTGECNGITMKTTAYDVFIFTNGKEARTVCFTSDEAYSAVIEGHNPVKFPQGWIATIDAEDYEGNKLHWLSMDVFDGSLAVASEYGPRGSAQNDIYTWNQEPKDATNSWFINMTKKVTAVYTFTGGLYIFTEDDCSRLTGNPNDTNSSLITSAGVGCYSWESIVKHDIYLFFYDHNQKNIYYLSPTDTTGQIRPSGPVAREIQSSFNNISRFKMHSCVYNNRNEVWCIVNDNILIYDYIQQEWVTRQQQTINDIELFDNQLLTAAESGVVYAEHTADDFSGAYFPSSYQTTFINAGSNSNIKKQKTPLLIVLNSNFVNEFYVQLIVDNKIKSPKKVKVAQIQTGIYGAEDGSSTDSRTKYGTAKYSPENIYKKTVVEISTPQTWYTMGIKIFTTQLGHGFFINSMELKNMKGKTKTKGR